MADRKIKTDGSFQDIDHLPTITISYLRNNFSKVIRELNETNEVRVITRYGKPLAVIMSFETSKKMQSLLHDLKSK